MNERELIQAFTEMLSNIMQSQEIEPLPDDETVLFIGPEFSLRFLDEENVLFVWPQSLIQVPVTQYLKQQLINCLMMHDHKTLSKLAQSFKNDMRFKRVSILDEKLPQL